MKTSRDNYLQYMWGWHHGAGRRAMDQDRAKHQDAAFALIYVKGYKDGQAAGRKVGREAGDLYGYQPMIIRAASE